MRGIAGMTGAVALLLSLFIGVAGAADEQGKVRALFQRAQALYAADKLVEAGEAFETACALRESRACLFNAATAFEAAGHDERALKHFRRYLVFAWNAPNVLEVQAHTDVIVARIEATYPKLTVNTSPPAATLSLDATSQRGTIRTPATIPAPPGKHRVVLEKPGYITESLDIEMVAGTPQSITVKLKPSAGDGRAVVQVTPPDAMVQLNGKIVGAPFDGPLREGSYWVTVDAKDHRPYSGSLLVRSGETATLKIDLASSLPPPRFPYGESARAAGVGAACLLAGGLAFGALAESRYDDLEDTRRDGKLLNGADIDEVDRFTTAQTVLYGLGAATALTAGVLWYLDIQNPPLLKAGIEPTARISPVISPFGAGFVGTF